MLSLASLFGDDSVILEDTNFQILLLTATLPVLGSAVISPILDSLIQPLNTNSTSIGLLISAFSAPSIVMIPVAGILADRYGRKPVLIISVILFGASGTAIAFASDFLVVLTLRFLQGIGFAGITPVIVTCIGDMYHGDKEAAGQGIRFMVTGLSGAGVPLIASLLILFAWQYPFVLYAVSLPVAIAIYLWFDDPSVVSASVATDGDDRDSYLRSLVAIGLRRQVLSIVLARALMMTVWVGFVAYNSLIVSRILHESPVEAGILATTGYFVFSLSASQAGRVTTMLESRLYLLIGANCCLGIGFVTCLFAPGLGVATFGIATMAVGVGFLGALYRSIITGLVGPNFRAGIVSISEAGARLIATLTPFAMGGLIALLSPSFGFTNSLQFAGITMAMVGAGGSILCLIVASQ